MKPSSPNLTGERLVRSKAWSLLLLLAGLLFVVFILASVNLIRTAISSQPDCVAHERMGSTNSGQSSAAAAKSAC